MQIENVRPYGLEIAASGVLVEPGESVEVDTALGKSLLQQPDNWAPVGKQGVSDEEKAAKAEERKAKAAATRAAKAAAKAAEQTEGDDPEDNDNGPEAETEENS